MINQDLKTTDKAQTHSANQGRLLIIAIAWLAGLSVICSIVGCQQALKAIATDGASGYDERLSKLVSGQPIRNPLAFFVPDNGAASQAVTMPSSTAPNALKNASRGQTIISMANHLPADYDGLTLQNRTAERRICGAVSNKTESKTRHPILSLYSVAFTQNLLGGHNHA